MERLFGFSPDGHPFCSCSVVGKSGDDIGAVERVHVGDVLPWRDNRVYVLAQKRFVLDDGEGGDGARLEGDGGGFHHGLVSG